MNSILSPQEAELRVRPLLFWSIDQIESLQQRIAFETARWSDNWGVKSSLERSDVLIAPLESLTSGRAATGAFVHPSNNSQGSRQILDAVQKYIFNSDNLDRPVTSTNGEIAKEVCSAALASWVSMITQLVDIQPNDENGGK
jgi:hypothetical protein